ncbi:MAG: transposase [Mariprofundus sp.]
MKSNKITANASQNIADRLVWQTAHKDQTGISRDLASGKDIPEVYGLGEAGLFDEFFFFLDNLGISNLFKALDPELKKRQSNVNFHTVLLIYMMRIVSGVSFFWHIEPVLLASQPLMRLVGFNGREIRQGTSSRGLSMADKLAQESQEPEDFGKIRGPICPDSVASCIVTITASALETFFNGVISILAANAFFAANIHASLDASEIQSTESCTGCGKVSKEKAPELRRRKGRIRKVVETVFGFKIWVVWDPNSKMPLAVRFTTIEVGDVIMAREVVAQAIKNIGEHARLASLAFDRGFIDGKFMWWLNSQGVIFYVPAKKNMDVYNDALALVDGGIRQIRKKKRSVGYGKKKRTVEDCYEAVGITGLTSAGFYGEAGSGSHEHKKDFIANPINAVVVVTDPFKANNPNINTLVILTNGPVKRPLKAYDGYDARSEIENGMFREAKQAWYIQRPARNSIDGFRAHVYLTIITMALTTAFRVWMDDQDAKNRQGEDTGIRKFREKVREENGNKLIVFDEDRYAIFDVYEVFILTGSNVTKPRGVLEVITKEDILRKYGVQLE